MTWPPGGPAVNAVRAYSRGKVDAHVWHRGPDGRVFGVHPQTFCPDSPSDSAENGGPELEVTGVSLKAFHLPGFQAAHRWAVVLHLARSRKKIIFDRAMATLVAALMQDEPGVQIDHQRWLYDSLNDRATKLDWTLWARGPTSTQISVLKVARTEDTVNILRWNRSELTGRARATDPLNAWMADEHLPALQEALAALDLAVEIDTLTGTKEPR